MSRREITFILNDRAVSGQAEPRTHLADFLREDLLMTGTHLGCEQGVCGACTLFVDGRPVRACITLAASCEQAGVRTIEGFDDDPLMERLRDAFKRHHALQCGYCTPGMLATAYDIVRRLPNADTHRIRRELSGNLCRCTGYEGIVAAIADVLANDPPAARVLAVPRTRPPAASSAGVAAPSAEVPETAAPAESGLPIPEIAEFSDGVKLSRSVTISASADKAWPVLRDVRSVAASIPGASVDHQSADGIASGKVVVSMGPIRAKFAGHAKTQFDDDTRTGHVRGSGRDSLSRSLLQGALDFSLAERDDETSTLKIDMVYKLKGPLAQFGRPALVEEIADRLLKETAEAISARARGVEAPPSRRQALNGLTLMVSVLKGMIRRLFDKRRSDRPRDLDNR
jgi:aerobic carbon-monoxide dehydrogenase small subunit